MKSSVNKVANKLNLMYKTKTSLPLSKKIGVACNFLNENDMGNSCCKECIQDMPAKIKNIKYAINADMTKKVAQVCYKHKNDKMIGTYCQKCKNLLLLYSGNISQFSNEKINKELLKQGNEIVFLY